LLDEIADRMIIVAQTDYGVAIETAPPARICCQSYNPTDAFQLICFLTTPFDTKTGKIQSSASEKPRKPLIICSF
jgi:hypothetical protein